MIDKLSGDAKIVLSRRTILRMIVGAPLAASLGIAVSPLMRYFKPTMKAGNFFQPADMPKADQSTRFRANDFPDIWTCIPFMVQMRYTVFNPEGSEIREIPAFIIRDAQNRIVAYSRICPHCRHSQPINFVKDTAELPWGAKSNFPVLCCPCSCDFSIFDLNDNGRVLSGPSKRPARKLIVTFDGEYYRIAGFEQNIIA